MTMVHGTWILGLLACGMGVALLGSVKVSLARRLGMDEARVGGLVSMFGFAMMPVMLVMGFLTDLLDKQLVIVVGSLLITASLVILARARSYGAALLAVLFLSRATQVARASPMAVPSSSIRPILTLSKNDNNALWSRVSGHWATVSR